MLSDRLREGMHITTKEFIALCEYNINPNLDAYLEAMTGAGLQAASAIATVGISRC